jgi:hypothetical protein
LGAAALWRTLPAPHRRWIVLNALLITAAINLIVNGVIAWLSVRWQADVPFWARPLSETSLLGDTLGTLFVLPLVTGALCTMAVWRELKTGELAPVRPIPPHDRWLARLPRPGLRRMLTFGVLAFLLLAPIVTLTLVAIDVGTLTRGEFVAFKTAFAIALGALVTPVIAICAMADQPEK